MNKQGQKGEHSEEENQWVFDEKSYSNDEGINLDIDKVEKIMKPQAGARFVGDVRDSSFVPVGFRKQDLSDKKVETKPQVEFRNLSVHKKSVKKTASLLSKLEGKFFTIFKK